jgi:type II secretory pathway pseudopilin PulG
MKLKEYDMKYRNTTNTSTRVAARGYSLVEICFSLVIMALVMGVLMPTMNQIRLQARGVSSADNLMTIGQARDLYAQDNKDRIYTYTWRAGEVYLMPDGTQRIENSDMAAAQRQNQEIIMRRTGRINGQFKIKSVSSRIPHRRYVHLIIMDEMAGDDDASFLNSVFADPADGDLLNWQEQPSFYSVPSGIPYAGGWADDGFENDNNWPTNTIRQRWAFGTSYHSVPSAWQPDGFNGETVYVPIRTTPHLYLSSGSGSVDLTGRLMSDVRFPDKKVHLFEEFDRERKRQPYFAYGQATVDKLMFDGSINSQRSSQSNDAMSPDQPGEIWKTRYVPLDTFPIPLDGLGSSHEINMRFMWTDLGLQGVDYD